MSCHHCLHLNCHLIFTARFQRIRRYRSRFREGNQVQCGSTNLESMRSISILVRPCYDLYGTYFEFDRKLKCCVARTNQFMELSETGIKLLKSPICLTFRKCKVYFLIVLSWKLIRRLLVSAFFQF